MMICGSCGIKLSPRELEVGECDICGAPVSEAHASSGMREDVGSEPHVHITGTAGWNWGTFRSGLLCVMIGIIVGLVGGGLLAALLATTGTQSPEASNIRAFGMGELITLFAGFFFLSWAAGSKLTGLIMVNAVPGHTGGKKWAMLTTFFAGLMVIMDLATGSILAKGQSYVDQLREQGTLPVLGITLVILWVLVDVCWNMLMVRTARSLGNSGLASGFLVWLIASLLIVGVIAGLTWGNVLGFGSIAWLIITGIAAVALGIWHLGLLSGLRHTIVHAMEH